MSFQLITLLVDQYQKYWGIDLVLNWSLFKYYDPPRRTNLLFID